MHNQNRVAPQASGVSADFRANSVYIGILVPERKVGNNIWG